MSTLVGLCNCQSSLGCCRLAAMHSHPKQFGCWAAERCIFPWSSWSYFGIKATSFFFLLLFSFPRIDSAFKLHIDWVMTRHHIIVMETQETIVNTGVWAKLFMAETQWQLHFYLDCEKKWSTFLYGLFLNRTTIHFPEHMNTCNLIWVVSGSFNILILMIPRNQHYTNDPQNAVAENIVHIYVIRVLHVHSCFLLCTSSPKKHKILMCFFFYRLVNPVAVDIHLTFLIVHMM